MLVINYKVTLGNISFSVAVFWEVSVGILYFIIKQRVT